MKIGILTHNFPLSKDDRQNAGVFVYDLAEELSKKNNVVVFAPGKKNGTQMMGRVKIHWFKWKEGKLGNLRLWNPIDLFKLISFFINGFRQLDNFYLQNKIDQVIAMWAFPSGLFAYLLNKKFHVSYCVWALGSDIYIYAQKPFLKGLIRKILHNARVLLADGIDLTRQVEDLSGKKCHLLPSASRFENIEQKISKKEKSISIAFLGRMEAVKGADVLIEALMRIKGHKIFKVHMMGAGSLLSILKKRVNQNGLSDQVKFYGNVGDKNAITKVLSRSDWIVIPSRSDSIPLVFSEAMKMKLPVIASDLPDLKYLVKKYKIGYTFPVEDSKSLSEILKALPTRADERNRFVKNTKNVAKIFSIESSARQLIEYIK